MKKIRHMAAALLLCCIVTPVLGHGGQAMATDIPPLFNYGWERWNLRTYREKNGVWQYEMTCPEITPSMESLQSYALDVMAYCKAANPAPTSVTMRFRFEAGLSELFSKVVQAVGMTSGIRSTTSAFLNISSVRMKQDTNVSEIILVLDINNPYAPSPYSKEIPYGQALDAAIGIADDIALKTDDPREQIKLINEYMVANVDYGCTQEERRAHSIVGAFLDGKATCAGYASAVSSLCYLLDIPCFQIDDRENAHTWNLVKIENEWLMLDATFNAAAKGATDCFLVDKLETKFHHYTEDGLNLLAGYTDRLWQWQNAADKLAEGGILNGVARHDYKLPQPLTYHELAVILTRLDGVEAGQLPNRDVEGCPAWATPYMAYCVDSGYLDARFGTGFVSTADIGQILMNYFGSSTQTSTAVASMEWLRNGSVVLRGTFFAFLESCDV